MSGTFKTDSNRLVVGTHVPLMEALEVRAFLSACPAGAALKAQAIAEALRQLNSSSPGCAADSHAVTAAPSLASATATSIPATPAAHTRTAARRRDAGRRAHPHAVRNHPPVTTPTPQTPSDSSSAGNAVTAPFDPATLVAAQSVNPQPIHAAGVPELASTQPAREQRGTAANDGFDAIVTSNPLLLATGGLSSATSPLGAGHGLDVSIVTRSASVFGDIPIGQTAIPAIASRVTRAVTNLWATATTDFPAWLNVGPLAGFEFTDRELIFKAGALVLGVAGFAAGYCGYINTTRRRRRDAASARIQIYNMMGWQESF